MQLASQMLQANSQAVAIRQDGAAARQERKRHMDQKKLGLASQRRRIEGTEAGGREGQGIGKRCSKCHNFMQGSQMQHAGERSGLIVCAVACGVCGRRMADHTEPCPPPPAWCCYTNCILFSA